MNMIEIKNLTKNFGNFPALKGFSLSIPQGTLFSFLGPNGAGKTTTIKLLVGLLKPTSGEIYLNGVNALKEPDRIREWLSYMPDEPYLYEKLTGREYLEFVANIYKVDNKRKENIINRLIPLFHLEDKLDNLIEDYSHGMRQKLIITSTLIHKPKIILVDEPLVGLDPYSARIFKRLLREFCQEGGTVFLSTHTLTLVEELSDLIGIIKEGELIFFGALQKLKHTVKKESSLEELFLDLTAETGEETSSVLI